MATICNAIVIDFDFVYNGGVDGICLYVNWETIDKVDECSLNASKNQNELIFFRKII